MRTKKIRLTNSKKERVYSTRLDDFTFTNTRLVKLVYTADSKSAPRVGLSVRVR